jgi:sulfate adenylyltransferase subunit 1 (EFTu-like GTPase family)
MDDKLEILCPCCEATISVDAKSGQVLWHKEKPAPVKSLDAMLSQLEAKKSETARRFEKEMEAQKDRSRILDMKFKEALKEAEKSDRKPINPMDLD